MVKLLPRRHPHPVEWLTAAPLWDLALQDGNQQRFRQPALLRFDSDQFMDHLIDTLATKPTEVQKLVAQPETWEQPRAGWVAQNTQTPLKLYQPAHNRFYLVAATLVCHIPGLPDRKIDPACKEKASFVLRRLVKGVEYGWVPSGNRVGWFQVEKPATVLADEERLPLFQLNHAGGERNRRLLAGFIPVTSRETYAAGPDLSPIVAPDPADGEDDPRLAQFTTRVEKAIEGVMAAGDQIDDLQRREISTFVMLDFAQLLSDYCRDLWGWVLDGRLPEGAVGVAKVAFWYDLQTAISATDTWASALKRVWNDRAKITAGETEAYTVSLLDVSTRNLSFAKVLAEYPLPTEVADPPSLPKIDPAAGDTYVLRCVYERPCCKDLSPPVVSSPTRPFLLAGFFDPDAPTRPVRIVMPVDTSVAGLRKFQKGVSFIVSEKLRSQMERFTGIKKFEDAENPKPDPGLTLGKICSLSIPIITIAALVLLFIIVQILNIVFWWVPFLKICFPIKRK